MRTRLSHVVSVCSALLVTTLASAQVTVEVWRGAVRDEPPSSYASNASISLTLSSTVTRVNIFAPSPVGVNIGAVQVNSASPVDVFLGSGAIPPADVTITTNACENFAGITSVGAPVRFAGAWGGNLTGPISVHSIVRAQTLTGDIQASITTTNAGNLASTDIGCCKHST